MAVETGVKLVKMDLSAMSVNQVFIILLPIIGFIFDTHWPGLFVGVVLLLGLLHPGLALFTQIYKRVVKPLGLLKPVIEEDDPTPHRFAHLLGGIFLFLANVLLFAGFWTSGWALCWIVVALAALNLQLGFCLGCFIYLHLPALIKIRGS